MLVETYENNAPGGPYSPDARSTGMRALRNGALAMLATTEAEDDLERVAKHYRNAPNMTDTIAALTILAHLQHNARKEAFDDFYQRWKEDHLVIDKWFALQAVSSLPSALDKVKALSLHRLFSLKMPNKVRALISTFANLNPVGFNRADGAGYEFVADAVLKIDGFNPQIAARLMGSFKSWKMLEPVRRERANSELERVARFDGLSRDTFEIVTKTLE